MPDTSQALGDSRSLERRHYPRQRVPFCYIHLADDNGGIILDISERGLSLQAVRSLTEDELPHIRFQTGENPTWIETRGRIAWERPSEKTAGLEFIDLADEARDQIRRWCSSELKSKESVEGIAFVRKPEPTKDFPTLLHPESPIPFPELETTEEVLQNPDPLSIPEDTDEDQPGVEKILRYSGRTSSAPDVPESAHVGTGSLLAWSELEARINREIKSRERTGFSPRSNRIVGLAVVTLLLMSVFFLVGHYWHEGKHSNVNTAATAFVKPPEPSPNPSTGPTNQASEPAPASEGPALALQVAATTNTKAAEALATTLKRKYFPAFVYFRGTDQYYRVLVGPFNDDDSRLRTMEELKTEGFESFRTPWNPSAAQPPGSAPSP
jgi:hypothetical protein